MFQKGIFGGLFLFLFLVITYGDFIASSSSTPSNIFYLRHLSTGKYLGAEGKSIEDKKPMILGEKDEKNPTQLFILDNNDVKCAHDQAYCVDFTANTGMVNISRWKKEKTQRDLPPYLNDKSSKVRTAWEFRNGGQLAFIDNPKYGVAMDNDGRHFKIQALGSNDNRFEREYLPLITPPTSTHYVTPTNTATSNTTRFLLDTNLRYIISIIDGPNSTSYVQYSPEGVGLGRMVSRMDQASQFNISRYNGGNTFTISINGQYMARFRNGPHEPKNNKNDSIRFHVKHPSSGGFARWRIPGAVDISENSRAAVNGECCVTYHPPGTTEPPSTVAVQSPPLALTAEDMPESVTIRNGMLGFDNRDIVRKNVILVPVYNSITGSNCRG